MISKYPVFRDILFMLLFFPTSAISQNVVKLNIPDTLVLTSSGVHLSDSVNLTFKRKRPVISFLADEKIYDSDDVTAIRVNEKYILNFADRIKVTFGETDSFPLYWDGELIFENISADTISISNVIPFSADEQTVYITGKGPWDLARAWLFRPGFSPVRVILPDNAWELGYVSFEAEGGYSVCAVTRRKNTEGGQRQRYQTVLPPGAKVTYTMYADVFKGAWQDGLRLMFRDRYLYDLEKFDNSLFERTDLQWIKECYLIVLQMAWDREFYDRLSGKYTFPEVIKKGIEQLGFIDIYGIWPTWPRLGLDQRNQWDMYRDLPGGVNQLRSFAKMAQQAGTKFFIAYNPWDNSTRKEDHYKGMARLISETGADGVVLDTRGSSSRELQNAADSVRKGVIMYSEGMAIVKDMPGIISGRVHNAIYYSPELNLNKLIKPDFSIFRVCDVGEDQNHREIAIAFFNGYGTELNMFRPGKRDENYLSDLDFLSRTTFILRQNNDAFLDNDWTPLIETLGDKIHVNRWRAPGKTLYTILNMRPEGYSGRLFRVERENDEHVVSLWNHENVEIVSENGIEYAVITAEGWPDAYSGTRKEGSVDCIAVFKNVLNSKLYGDSLYVKKPAKGHMTVWKGNPSYANKGIELKILNDTVLRINDLFGFYEGKIVLQLTDGKRLIDENIHHLRGGKPWLISKQVKTVRATGIPSDMVLIPGAEFSYKVTTEEDFIPYPEVSDVTVKIDSFLIDKYPVTNVQYYEFLINTGYRPSDTVNYLRHWKSGIYRPGQERYPVVYISYEDASAYAKWAGKRLPSEAEWQLAAQGTDGRKWPWGNDFHGTNCNNAFDRSTPVDAFPKGQSQYGVMDLVGNVWQMTNDMYFNGSYYMIVIRGGSYYKPDT
ncbi:MAG: SUMF1/EgtB/PvdO family nonheme iron enzyme, partial [Bacteroidales bacterium]|nr:SUMF1/EgtB/PvdO family nonheme iron enzyme [Bacteroidales bacterium]